MVVPASLIVAEADSTESIKAPRITCGGISLITVLSESLVCVPLAIEVRY